MKLLINGEGGEFCVGKLSKEQEDFVFNNAQEGESVDVDEFWEDNQIMGSPWYEFNDLAAINTVYANDKLSIKSESDEEICALGNFEIDLENNKKFVMLDNNTKVILGWDHVGANFDKGFNSLRIIDFRKENLDHFKHDQEEEAAPCLIGTKSREYGTFWELELPEDFDQNKLILIKASFKFQENMFLDFITNVIYDGKIIEQVPGDTVTKEVTHFVLECNNELDELLVNDINESDIIEFDYALEFYS